MLLLYSCSGLSCGNEMKYILFEGTEKLHGYVIFEKHRDKNLYYFDLEQNKVFEIPFAKARMTNGIEASYDFYKDSDKNIMINYVERNNKPCLQFIELKFSDRLNQELLFTKEVEGIFINKIVDRFKYLHRSNELFYYSYYDRRADPYAKLVNLDTFRTRELFIEDAFTPQLVDFFDNKYLALGFRGIYFYDEDKIETIGENPGIPFIAGLFPVYSAVLRKVLYRNRDNESGEDTIAVFDIDSMRIINTGITAMKYNRYDPDNYKFHFFGEHYILYARYKEKASVLTKFLNPVEYVIYDYMNGKEVGYVKDCQFNAFYDFFPKYQRISRDAEVDVTKLIETRGQL